MLSQQFLFTVATSILATTLQLSDATPIEGKPGIGNFPTGNAGFQYYIDTTTVYASAAPSTPASTYAPLYSQLSTLIGTVSTTTWGNWYPNATATATDSDDPYGQYSWSKLWETTEFVNFTRGIYSTTVSPTPVPTSSLVYPPEDPVKGSFDHLGIKFPKDFIQGVAGSAGQIEGAVADEGRSPSILEIAEIKKNEPENYVTNENYYLYKQDIARLAAIGVEHYSFTIPWTRILPFVFPGTPVNQLGLDHYDDLINTVLEYGLKPIVTLTHFDSPLQFYNSSAVMELGFFNISGGYARPDFVEAFVNYGKIVMSHYADRVPIWITFNEPIAFAENAVGAKHIVQAHAQLHDFYHNEIKGSGKVGLKLSSTFGFPQDPTNAAHVTAADRFNEFQFDIIANPLFSGIDVPQSVKNTLLKTHPELAWTAEELAAVKGKSDYFGVDPYVYNIIIPLNDTSLCEADPSSTTWPNCVETAVAEEDGWAIGYRSQSYVYITPRQLRVCLNYIWQHWHAPVFITEFGFPEFREGQKLLKDQQYDLARSIYYRSFLTAALEAHLYDGVDMMGALAWSFADNWEFGDYQQQFGLQVVNRTTQERFYKKSFFDFVSYINDNREF